MMLSQRQLIKAISGLQEIFSSNLIILITGLIIVCMVIKASAPVYWHKYRRYFWLIVYGIFLLDVMWLGRTPSEVVGDIEWIPFIRIYEDQVFHETRLIGAILNVLIYLPYGYLNTCVMKKRMLAIGCIFITSIIIEIGQYFCLVGTFKIENLITNTVGGILGMILYSYIDKRREND